MLRFMAAYRNKLSTIYKSRIFDTIATNLSRSKLETDFVPLSDEFDTMNKTHAPQFL